MTSLLDADFILVALTGWGGKAYLKRADVQVLEKSSVGFFSIFGRRNAMGKATQDVGNIEEETEAFSEGDELETVYGAGKVLEVRIFEEAPPVVVVKVKEEEGSPEDAAVAPTSSATPADAADVRDGAKEIKEENNKAGNKVLKTLVVELNGWGGTLYCTESQAVAWRERFGKKRQSGIFHVLGSIVRRITYTQKTLPDLGVDGAIEEEAEQFYEVGATVKADNFGKGTVTAFRGKGNIYVIKFDFGVGYMTRASLSRWVSEGCTEGCNVVTSLGLTGRLISVEERTGFHEVELGGEGRMTCHLRADDVVGKVEASKGDKVFTWWGEGVVERYRVEDGIYQVGMTGWGAKVFVGKEDIMAEEDEKHAGGWGGWLSKLWGSGGQQPAKSRRNRTRTMSLTDADLG